MHTTPSQHPDDDEQLPDEGEPAFGEEDLGDMELDRDDTHGLADEVAARAEGHG